MQKLARPDHLRDYQQEAVYKIQVHLRDQRSTLAAMAPGVGKTHVFLAWLRQVMESGDRAMIVVNRRQLAQQAAARIAKFFPSLHPAGIVMAGQRDTDARVIVATVQSLDSGMRLNEILTHGPITHLVSDEAHRATADSYERVYSRLYEANPGMKHLGVTATPRRADDVALKSVFESVAVRLPLSTAVEMGCLVPFVVQGFYVPEVDISDLAPTGEDWSDKSVGKIMSEKAMLDTVVEKWKEHSLGRPTIAFCATTGQAHKTARWFRDAGFAAEAADYRSSDDERDAIIHRFENGETTIICNFGLWAEGSDFPIAETGLMLRIHMADGPYIQKAGRMLRPYPGKKTALIMDFVPAGARNMVMGGDLLGGTPKSQKKAEDKAADLGIIPAFGIDRGGKGIDGDPDDVIMRVLNYLIKSSLAWKKGDRIATIGLSDTKTLVVVFPDEERLANAEKFRDTPRWNDACQREHDRISKLRVFAIEQYKNPKTGKRGAKNVRSLGAFDSWGDIVPVTDDYAEQYQDSSLAKRAKRWRKLPPTDGQLKFVRRLMRPGDDIVGMKRGPLARWITHRLALQKLEQKRLI